MTDQAAARAARALFGLVVLCFVGTLAFFVLNSTGPRASGWDASPAVLAFAMLSFPAVGVLIASRQPRNAVGWLLLAIGLVWELGGAVSEGYVRYALVTNPGSLPRPDLVAVVMSSMWVPGVGLIGTFLILLFPDGRLPSPRWRPLARLSAFVLVFLTLLIPVVPGSMRDIAQVPYLPDRPNPLGIEGLRPVLGGLYVLLALLPLCIIGCALSLIGRFRRADARTRLQLKWLAAAAGITAALYLLAMAFSLTGDADWSGRTTPLWLSILQNIALFSFLLIPVAAGIAILRYRLYDIDFIINRALVYAALTATLAVVYVGGVLGIGAVARTVTDQVGNDVAIAASTLTVASLFRPLRRTVQSFIDRRFYRHKYDAEQTLDEFARSLRARVDLASVNAEVISVVTRTMHPRHVSIWMRSRS